VPVIRVPWSGAAFLAYAGGFTLLSGGLSLLGVQADEHGDAGLVLWSALVYGVFAALAYTALKTGHRVIAGLLAVATVAAFAVLIGALFAWFGWWQDEFDPLFKFRFSFLGFELLTVLASLVAWRIFRFPLLIFLLAFSTWFFVTDLISNGGDWSAIVTVLIGVGLFAAAGAADAGESPITGFWLHVASALAVGGGLLWFFHDGDLDWIIVGLAGLAYIAIGDKLARSSWIVIGAWGLLLTATHFADKWSDVVGGGLFPFYLLLFPFYIFAGDFGARDEHQWAGPLIYAGLGLFFFGLALLLARRRRAQTPGAELI
jgi:hypothetical protein